MNPPSAGRLLWLWVVATCWTVVHLLPAILVGVFSQAAGYRLGRRWALRMLATFGIDVEVVDRNAGRPIASPILYVFMNQTSLSEVWFMYLFSDAPIRFMTNIEFFLIPLVGWQVWFNGGTVVVRQWHWQAKLAVAKAVRGLRKGQSWGISIEGRRSPDGSLQPYKKGPAWMALQTGATIVPFFLEGARDCWPPGTWRVRPGRVRLTLCEPIPTTGLTPADRGLVVRQLQEIARRELGEGAAAGHVEVGEEDQAGEEAARAGGEGDAS